MTTASCTARSSSMNVLFDCSFNFRSSCFGLLVEATPLKQWGRGFLGPTLVLSAWQCGMRSLKVQQRPLCQGGGSGGGGRDGWIIEEALWWILNMKPAEALNGTDQWIIHQLLLSPLASGRRPHSGGGGMGGGVRTLAGWIQIQPSCRHLNVTTGRRPDAPNSLSLTC